MDEETKTDTVTDDSVATPEQGTGNEASPETGTAESGGDAAGDSLPVDESLGITEEQAEEIIEQLTTINENHTADQLAAEEAAQAAAEQAAEEPILFTEDQGAQMIELLQNLNHDVNIVFYMFLFIFVAFIFKLLYNFLAGTIFGGI